MRISKRVFEGELVEWYYGYGFRDYVTNSVFVYVIPLNIFVQIGRYLWWKLRMRHFEPSTDKFDIAYRQGFDTGKRVGVQEGRNQKEKEMLNSMKTLEKNLRDAFTN